MMNPEYPEHSAEQEKCLDFLRNFTVSGNWNKYMDILKEIKKYLGTVEKYEIPKECYFFKEPCSLENGLLSLKLEPKRQEIIRQWKNLIFVNKKHNESS